jgi:hypothetical protein
MMSTDWPITLPRCDQVRCAHRRHGSTSTAQYCQCCCWQLMVAALVQHGSTDVLLLARLMQPWWQPDHNMPWCGTPQAYSTA